MALRRLLLGLMICLLFGCAELEIPEVSVEFLEYDEEMARFQLQADPEPTRDLAVLLNFNSDGETFHIWQAIPEELGTKEFAIELDRYVSWDVAILSLERTNLKDYPVGGRELSSNAIYGEYLLGSPSRLQTIPVKIPEVSLGFLEYYEEGAWFQLQTEPAPTTELAVLLTFKSLANGETFHIWQAIPEELGTKEFAVELDKYVSWDVAILGLEGINLNDYPVSGFGLSTKDRFSKYTLESTSRVRTIPVAPAPVREGKMYWTDSSTGKIQRANLDGSNVQDLVTGLNNPQGIALDVAGGKMYWTEKDWGNDKIQRANLDGSNRQVLLDGFHSPQGIALDVIGDKMYWATGSFHAIQCANLDGSNVQNLVPDEAAEFATGIALDVADGKMYWTDSDRWTNGERIYGKIQRANLDGSNVQDLVTRNERLIRPWDIALDVAGGKMYWATWSVIQCANLDGSNVQDLVTGLDGPQGIALDVADGKMYWTDYGRPTTNGERIYGKIQHANLDGSNVQDLVTGLDGPQGIALDVD